MAERIVKPLNHELRNQVTIYFEEGLLHQGLDYLTTLLTAGASSPTGPLYIPSSSHLSLLVTLLIHPNFTNRAKDASSAQVSLLAHRYLTLLNQLVSPLDACVVEAYTWPEMTLTRRGFKRRRGNEDDAHSNSAEESDAPGSGIRSPYARARSVFEKTDDFWSCVAWAFRCSVLHASTRWPAWELWLEYMVETLERDLNERFVPEEQVESLIARYAKEPEKRRKRIMRAIFADGSARFENEFREVWKNETREKVESKKRAAQVRKIDVENDDFGDYMDVSTDDELEAEGVGGDAVEGTSEVMAKRRERIELDATAQLGGHAAVKLRMRLLGLLIKLGEALPMHYGNPWTWYDLCREYLKPLELPAFSVAISPPMLATFSEDSAIGLVKFMAHLLLESGAKKVSRAQGLSQVTFVEAYLPYAANTNMVVDNGRLSMCLEALMMMLDLQRKLHYGTDLEMAVEQGIEKRLAKATARGKKGEASGERDIELDKEALNQSAMRLRMLVHLNKAAGERS